MYMNLKTYLKDWSLVRKKITISFLALYYEGPLKLKYFFLTRAGRSYY